MFSAWALTVRPKDGLTDTMLQAIDKFAHRCKYHLLGVEKEGTDKHAHLGIFLDKPSTKSNICNRLLAAPALKCLASAEVKVLRAGVKIMYNSDYIFGYIGNEDKGDAYTEVSRSLPDDIGELESFYPPPGDTSAKKPVSIWYATRAAAYDGPTPATEVSVLRHLMTLMFSEKTIEVIADQRILQQKCRALKAYINSYTDPTYLDPRMSTDVEHRVEQSLRCGQCRANLLTQLSDETH